MKSGLYRSVRTKKLAGVCSGMAQYFEVDVTMIRVAFCIGFLMHGIGIVAYIILWIAMPENPSESWTPPRYNSVPPGSGGTAATFDGQSFIPQNPKKRRQSAIFAGIALILTGMYFLMLNFFPMLEFESYAPFFLILAGSFVLVYAFVSKESEVSRTQQPLYATQGWTASSSDDSAQYQSVSTQNNAPTTQDTYNSNVADGSNVASSVGTTNDVNKDSDADHDPHIGGMS